MTFAPYGPNDLAREAALRERVGAIWNCRVVPFAEHDPVDVRLERDKRTIGVAELKCHQYRIPRGFYISDHKPPAVRRLAAGFGVPGFLVAAFDNGRAYWVPIARARTVAIDYRARRDCNGRLEPPEWVAYLDWSPWRPLTP